MHSGVCEGGRAAAKWADHGAGLGADAQDWRDGGCGFSRPARGRKSHYPGPRLYRFRTRYRASELGFGTSR